jgi:Ca2+-binding EF-hand superfamily protein
MAQVVSTCTLPSDPVAILNLLFPLVDTNGDGGLALAELQVLYADIPAQYYNLVDSNRDGKVTMAELKPFLSLLPALLSDVNLLSYVDSNGNGAIEYAEVSKYVTPAQFALLDKDGNGVFDCTDLPPVTPPAEGETPPPPPPCPLPADIVPFLANLLIPAVDADQSGGLSLAEIQAIYPIPAQYTRYFSLVDPNGDGQVDIKELALIVSALGIDLLGEIDSNGDRIVQYSEVSRYVSSEQFALLDRNGNGVIDCGDLPPVTPPVEGEMPPSPLCPLPPDVVFVLAKTLVPMFDADQSGGLSLAEIRAIYSIPDKYADYFTAVDLNKNGQIEPKEIAVFVSGLNADPLGMIDADGDRVIQYSEVSQYVTKAQFALLDRNGNGAVDCGDLPPVMPPVEGELPPPPSCPLPPDIVFVLAKMLVPMFDADNSGGLSLAEIQSVYPIPDKYVQYFPAIDANQDGQIQPEEIVAALSRLNSDPLGYIDGNGDRVIQYSEVSQYVTPKQFALLDRNGDGVFDCVDFGPVLPPAEGETPPPPFEGETPPLFCPIPNVNSLLFDAVFAVLDVNRDGGVTMDEVIQLVPWLDAAQLQLVFTALGADADGRIARAALDRIPSLLPMLGINLPYMAGAAVMPNRPDMNINILGLIDTNGDGLLQPSEVSPYVSDSVFAMLDTNANGVLDCEDLKALLQGNGAEGEAVEGEPVVACPLPDLRPMIGTLALLLDKNQDGLVCRDEVGGFVSPLMSMMPGGIAVDFFAMADQDGDGCLNAKELGALANLIPFNPVTFLDANGNGVLEEKELSMLIGPAEFARADTNQNGAIDCEDLPAILAWLSGREGEGTVEGEPNGPCPLSPDMLFVVALRLVDVNGDGGVSLQELQTVVPQVPEQYFQMADTNGDGLVDAAELKAFVLSPPIQTLLPLPTAKDIFARIDTNRNGVIEYAEISGIFTKDRFAAADANGNGIIDCEDVSTAPQPVEGEVPPVEGEGAYIGLDGMLQGLRGSQNLAGLMQDAFSMLDADGDGALSFGEISARIKLPRGAFNAADTNGDGKVTWDEVSALARQADTPSESVIDLVREVAGRFGNQFFAPGDVIRVTLRLTKHGDGVLRRLHLLEALPEGWIVNLISGATGVSAKSVGANTLMLDWSNATAFPLEIVYEATAPANASGLLTVTGQADYETVNGATESTGAVASVLAEALPEDQAHTADVDGDWHLSLSEVLRVIQLYNAGGYGVETDTEDGYAPGGGKQAGIPHDADYNGDWQIDISELLRVVQLFNAPGGAYYRASGTEDGFVPGLF